MPIPSRLVLDSVADRLDSALASRQDSAYSRALNGTGGGAFLERQLEHVLTRVLEQPIAPLNGFRMFPIGRDVPEGAESYVQKVRDMAGQARVGGSMSDDPPMSDVSLHEFTMQCASVLSGFKYTIDEIAAAMMAGSSLSVDRGTAAQRADLQAHNTIMFHGHKEKGLFGLFTHPIIPRTVLAARPTTADEWLNMLNSACNRINTRTKGLATGFRVVLPLDVYSYVSTTARSSSSDLTILAFFLANNPHVSDVLAYHEGQGAGLGGADIIAVYPPVEDVISYEVPKMWTPLPVQERNYTFTVPCHSRSGGMHVKVPIFCELIELPAAA